MGGEVLKAIIFDLDGTLADTLPLCFAGFREVFARRGRTFTDQEIRAMFGPSEEGVFERVLGVGWEQAVEEYLAFYEAEHDRCTRPIAGVAELMSALRERGMRMAIVTAKGPRSARITIERLGLADDVDGIRAGSSQGHRKAEAIQETLRDWSLPGEDVAYVGDAPSDMRAARSAGVVALGAAWTDGVDPDALRAAGALEVFISPGALGEWISAPRRAVHAESVRNGRPG